MHWQLLTAVLVVAAPAPSEKKDEDKIQGTWTVVSIEHAGMKDTDEDAKKTTVVFKDGNVILHVAGNTKKAKITLDPAKKPKTIDMMPEEKREKPSLGIYELKGDELRLCFAEDGGERPSEFATRAGSDQTLVVLKREKKDK
jgi:uncharacterized protein (TIGR03067 family)